MPQQNLIARNTIVAAYASEGDLGLARMVFDAMPEKNVVSWTTIVRAYAQNGHLREARVLFEKMPERDVVTWNSMVTAYAQNGLVDQAVDVLNQMPCRDVVSWHVTIPAYSHNGHNQQAIALFRKMDLEGLQPNEITFVTIFDACATVSLLRVGKLIHAEAVPAGFSALEPVSTSILTMYGKCGSLEEARRIFDAMPERRTVSWSAMISAYPESGHGLLALDLFKEMGLDGVEPDGITSIAVLSSCCHWELKDGWTYFVSLRNDYGVDPMAEHYICIADHLGRAGRLAEAQDLIHNMPFHPSPVAWTQLLSAYKTHGNNQTKLNADELAQQVQKLDETNSSCYVLLSSTYES
ncbi:pentatricopeptide repeat-containing protein At4g02750-like [Selaginella moellendorffii]|uniref:pentatricopeptide repeat-containing protein At4g02750-like n=1 Tax=Selaginella moellendorffii TaxID=88036 RepID=UPI000D1CBAC6|nr:pentatricopeptide repeat-containing protein At4g02750-like [Selaginella moellendorffii]|eukprot:XP_024519813.1 pentatricopeptide repeat-containing protein At4g02750-like [Selaginella moellendorffii]